jgi:hypothetical protein
MPPNASSKYFGAILTLNERRRHSLTEADTIVFGDEAHLMVASFVEPFERPSEVVDEPLDSRRFRRQRSMSAVILLPALRRQDRANGNPHPSAFVHRRARRMGRHGHGA